MKKHFWSLLILLAATHAATSAKPRTTSHIRQAAARALSTPALDSDRLNQLHSSDVLTVLGQPDGGYAVVSNDDLLPEVLAVVHGSYSGQHNPAMQWWLRAIEQAGRYCTEHGITAAQLTESASDFDLADLPDEVYPLVSAQWGQSAPYYNLCPTKNGQHCLTGCVATALAQIIYTVQYPTSGYGQRTAQYYGNTYTADYGNTIYDYANMIDSYSAGYTAQQAQAVAVLMMHCGLASNMDYNTNGSGTFSEDAAAGMRNYFGFEQATCHHRSDYSASDWKLMVMSELAQGHPLYYSAVDALSMDGGHAFVCDGYDEQGLVHINWGWTGSEDGYFNMDLLDPPGMKFSYGQDIITGVYNPDAVPASSLLALEVDNPVAGKLLHNIGFDNLPLLKSITIRGTMNESDFALLRQLAQGKDLSDYGLSDAKGLLRKIDLSDVQLEGDALPDGAFQGCARLRSVTLPRQLASIGTSAFAGCSQLSTITSYSYKVPKMGKKVFDGVESDKVNVRVIAGSSDLYRRNAQWKKILSVTNLSEFGTCIKANNAQRAQGANNPVLGYQMIGDRLTGVPELWTDATIDSPAGTYTIYIKPGSISATDNVVFVPGTLLVTEVSGIESLQSDTDSARQLPLDGTSSGTSPRRGLSVRDGRVVIIK
ncbi:MAG: C10 family peptidase [Bacteroidales bacterium]|nr:C10 family peptidase [Bacteroidales bacterium]